MGRDVASAACAPSRSCFNPRARMGRDLAFPTLWTTSTLFQPTRPHGARRRHPVSRQRKISFNPRARMGRDLQAHRHRASAAVSTHAPAWGATVYNKTRPTLNGFQPTRPHGARRLNFAKDKDEIRFNPRARMGRDHLDPQRKGEYGSFNPRARMGRDDIMQHLITDETVFQPTRPHGARHVLHCDDGKDMGVSTHAPAWGATFMRYAVSLILSRFQPTRPHGARLHFRKMVVSCCNVSTHAPAWGATLCLSKSNHFIYWFQPTRPHGARLHRLPAAWPRAVSTHAPAWGATILVGENTTKGRVFQPTRPHGARRTRTGYTGI